MEYVLAVPQLYPTVHVSVALQWAETISDLLFELGATGVEERDPTTLVGPDDGTESGHVTLVAHFDDANTAKQALARLPAGARVEPIVGDDWRHGWRAFFEPSRVGSRLVIRPPWKTAVASPGDVVVEVDPGQAFGTGTHETTRLVLAMLDAHLRGGEAVLDVGSGSGILAVSALLLGAARAECLDVDPEAVRATLETAERNGVQDRLRASAGALDEAVPRFDVVVANIESGVLVPMAATLATAVAPGGWLALSGILDEQVADVERVYLGQPGLVPAGSTREGGWVALRFVRSL